MTHETIVHSGTAVGWYRCNGENCPICSPFELSEWDFDHPGPYTYSAEPKPLGASNKPAHQTTVLP